MMMMIIVVVVVVVVIIIIIIIIRHIKDIYVIPRLPEYNFNNYPQGDQKFHLHHYTVTGAQQVAPGGYTVVTILEISRRRLCVSLGQ
jgi:hypothetical protein